MASKAVHGAECTSPVGREQRRHFEGQGVGAAGEVSWLSLAFNLSHSGRSIRKGSSVPVEEAGLSPKGHNDVAASVEVVACDCHLGATRHWSSLRLQVREGQSLWRQREVLETQQRSSGTFPLLLVVERGRHAQGLIRTAEAGHVLWPKKEPGVTPVLSETLCSNARFGGISSDPTPVCLYPPK